MNQSTENEPSAKKQSLVALFMSLLCNICNLEDKCYNFLETGEADKMHVFKFTCCMLRCVIYKTDVQKRG